MIQVLADVVSLEDWDHLIRARREILKLLPVLHRPPLVLADGQPLRFSASGSHIQSMLAHQPSCGPQASRCRLLRSRYSLGVNG